MALSLQLTDTYFLWAVSNQLSYIYPFNHFPLVFLVTACLAVAVLCPGMSKLGSKTQFVKKSFTKHHLTFYYYSQQYFFN